MNRGSGRDGGDGLLMGCGFNEAPIHESGKLPWTSETPNAVTPASMRPRFMNRGSSPDPYEIRDLANLLQ